MWHVAAWHMAAWHVAAWRVAAWRSVEFLIISLSPPQPKYSWGKEQWVIYDLGLYF